MPASAKAHRGPRRRDPELRDQEVAASVENIGERAARQANRNTGARTRSAQRDQRGEEVSDVMSQADATSFIHMQTFDAIHTSQSMRKVAGRAAPRPTSSRLSALRAREDFRSWDGPLIRGKGTTCV